MTHDDLKYLRMLAAHKQPQNVDLLAAHGQEPALSPPVSAITGEPEPTFEDKARFLSKLNEFAKLQGDRFIGEPLQAMNRIGGFMTGESNPYVVDEINDPRTVAIKQAKDTLEALGLYSGPGILTGKASANVLRTFGGELAERAPSKQSGRWFTGMEGKPRFEIDDSASALTKEFLDDLKQGERYYKESGAQTWSGEDLRKMASLRDEWKLSDIYQNENLYNQYPELKGVPVRANTGLDASASFSDQYGIEFNPNKSPDLHDSLTHEIQHWIQQKEGFARGGSPALGITPESQNILDEMKRPLVDELRRAKEAGDWGKADELQKKIMMDLPQEASLKAYQRLAGEIEARDAANRRTWPMDLRQTMPPDLRKDAIIRYGKP